MKPSQTLRAARALIEKPENWNELINYVGRNGMSFDRSERTAMQAICFKPDVELWSASEAAMEINRILDRSWDGLGVHTHAEVLAKFEEAIALAESEGN